MKRIISLIVCVLLLTSCYSALAATVTATGDVYVRSGPGLDYASLSVIDEGQTASYLGATAVDNRGVTWYKVFYNNVTGWISSRYSELDTWSWSYGYVTATGNVWVRTGPSLSYAKLGAIETGDTLEYRNESSVDDRGVTWYRVYYGTNDSAWISSRYSELTTYGSDATLVTATGNCNVRAGAGTEYDSLATMWKTDTAYYLGASAKDSRGITWYKVNYGGVTGWVSSKYATLGSSGSDDTRSYGTVTATGDANVRSGPGLAYDKVTNIAKGKTATYLGVSSTDSRGVAWYKISYNGYIGWISSRYATLGSGDSFTAWSYGTITATGDATIRSGPGLDYDAVTYIAEGNTASYLGNSSVDGRGVTWYKVEYNGKTGWVSSRYTRLN